MSPKLTILKVENRNSALDQELITSAAEETKRLCGWEIRKAPEKFYIATFEQIYRCLEKNL